MSLLSVSSTNDHAGSSIAGGSKITNAESAKAAAAKSHLHLHKVAITRVGYDDGNKATYIDQYRVNWVQWKVYQDFYKLDWHKGIKTSRFQKMSYISL